MIGPFDELDEDAPEPWRGDLHPDEAEDDWPEYLAGPEYWLYRRRLEDGEDREGGP